MKKLDGGLHIVPRSSMLHLDGIGTHLKHWRAENALPAAVKRFDSGVVGVPSALNCIGYNGSLIYPQLVVISGF